MMNGVDFVTPAERWGLKFFSRDLQYQAQGALAPSVMRGFMRPLNAQELIAAAMQQGFLLVIDAEQFAVVTGQETPRRFDRVVVGAQRLAVETWRGVPGVPPHTFFKMALIGGQQ
jgi:hypothetical protein